MLTGNIIGLMVLTIGGTLIGLVGLFARRPLSAWQLIAASAVLCVAAVGAMTGNLAHTWIAPAFVIGLFTLVLALQTKVAPAVFEKLRGSRVPWLVLALACPVGALIWTACSNPPEVPDYATPGLISAKRPVVLKKLNGSYLLTDAGRSIPLYAAAEPVDAEDLALAEHVVTDHRALSLIRTDAAGLGYNCHGWTFAEGRFWIMCGDVEAILKDNGFELVAQPQAGDIIIYRDAWDAVAHSGVVKMIQPDFILVESKWGKVGRFLHAPEAQPYALKFEYYRSSKPDTQGSARFVAAPPQKRRRFSNNRFGFDLWQRVFKALPDRRSPSRGHSSREL